jgi:enolase-phosphatase E1
MSVRAILTDIEGTTSSITFVHDVLFPYAREHLPGFVREHAGSPEVQALLEDTATLAQRREADPEALIGILLGWIDEDRKATPLKALQGMIWAHGYSSGAYRAHVYPEVPDQLRRWKDAGIGLYVYSSGSIPAQKLMFGHTVAGDLTPLFSGYFDTRTGAKRESAAYVRIASEIGQQPADILFLSDVVAELDAARASGMQTTLVCRGPQGCPADPPHPCVTRFDQIDV